MAEMLRVVSESFLSILEMEVKEMVVIHIPFSGLGQFVS
jgi:hypothetical protein